MQKRPSLSCDDKRETLLHSFLFLELETNCCSSFRTEKTNTPSLTAKKWLFLLIAKESCFKTVFPGQANKYAFHGKVGCMSLMFAFSTFKLKWSVQALFHGAITCTKSIRICCDRQTTCVDHQCHHFELLTDHEWLVITFVLGASFLFRSFVNGRGNLLEKYHVSVLLQVTLLELIFILVSLILFRKMSISLHFQPSSSSLDSPSI